MPVTKDDVIWCYQTFLDRSPESDEVIEQHVEAAPEMRALVARFVNSSEFLHRPRPDQTIDGFVYNDRPDTQARVIAILKLLEPVKIAGLKKVRIGNSGDGGYVMVEAFAKAEAAYSLGISDDVSWDMDIARRNIPVYQYDHTIDALPDKHRLFHWSKLGIAAEPAEGFRTLPDLMRANGHGEAGDLVLKCDIEGAEWDMFAAMTEADLGRFSQVVAEFHGFHYLVDPAFARRAERAFQRLTAGHRLVHVHANNHSALAIVGGVALPASMEMTFVRIAGHTIEPSDETFPTALDRPCNPIRADFRLGTFRFS